MCEQEFFCVWKACPFFGVDPLGGPPSDLHLVPQPRQGYQSAPFQILHPTCILTKT